MQVTFLHGDPYGQQELPKFVEEKVLEGYQALRAAEGSGVVMLRIADDAAVNRPCGITVDWDDPVTITHPSTPHCWSNVQAWEDSNDIIAKILLCRPASS